MHKEEASTYGIGQAGEDAVANYLSQRGYVLLVRNWKTRWCEIDIVAKKDNSVHFVEVKYRKNARHGSGLEYVTPTKRRQLKLAARMWIAENNWEGNYQIDAAGVDGATGHITYITSAVTG